MIGALSLLSSKGGRIVAELGITALLAGAIAWGCYEKGKAAGKVEANQETQQQIEKMVLQARESAKNLESLASTAVTQAEQGRKDADGKRAVAEAKLADLLAKAKQGQANVDALKPDQLHGYTVAALNLRKPDEKPACYTPAEEYAIAQAVTDLPNCKAQLAASGDKSAAQDQQLSVADALGNALKPLIEQWAALNGKLDQLFVQRDNLQPVKVRAWACLKLWKCGTKKMQAEK